MTVKVLDSYGLLAFLEKEAGYKIVETSFIEALEKNTNLLMSVVNFGEVYYIVLRECGEEKAQEMERVVDTLPITIVDVNLKITKEAARFKAFKKISYADCFAAALAKIHSGELITGDPEFKTVKDEIKVVWLKS